MKHLYYIAALAATFLTAMLFTRKKKQRTMLRSNNKRVAVRLKPAVGKETIRKIPVYPN